MSETVDEVGKEFVGQRQEHGRLKRAEQLRYGLRQTRRFVILDGTALGGKGENWRVIVTKNWQRQGFNIATSQEK